MPLRSRAALHLPIPAIVFLQAIGLYQSREMPLAAARRWRSGDLLRVLLAFSGLVQGSMHHRYYALALWLTSAHFFAKIA
jgi:hypothetical protein